jgi:iron-sulfur cluster repair protein YtfE (RIC family)
MDHLEQSHQRIERSLVTVVNAVASLRLTEPVLRAEAAAALDYELALLQLLTELHVQDEEESLFPRINRKVASNEAGPLSGIVPRLESQHREQQAIFRALAVCLRELSTSSPAAEGGLERLEELVGRLEALLRAHLAIEDPNFMSACRQHLLPSDLDEMRGEMQLRFDGKGLGSDSA